jgi:hypothetical protein
MSDDFGAYAEITVHFGSDTALQTFPYLGQATFMGHIEALLAGSRALTPRRFMPVCESPVVKEYMDEALDAGKFAEISGKPFPFEIPEMQFEVMDGLRMCGAIKGALAGSRVEKAGLKEIAAALMKEMEDLIILMAGAADRELKFCLRECEDPPALLVAWVANETAETVKLIREISDQIEKDGGKA